MRRVVSLAFLCLLAAVPSQQANHDQSCQEAFNITLKSMVEMGINHTRGVCSLNTDVSEQLVKSDLKDLETSLYEIIKEINVTFEYAIRNRCYHGQHCSEYNPDPVRQEVESAFRSVYVHWGHTGCRGSAKRLYEGQAAGGNYEYPGAAVNALCLPPNPDWNNPQRGNQLAARIYGAEYETSSFARYASKQDWDVPCAVCEVSRSAVLMIPGKRTCPDGWNKEYEGYLMSGYIRHTAASKFYCFDNEFQIIDGPNSKADKNGKLFYFTEAICEPLRWPCYTNGREVTCVVCSK